MAQLTWYLLTSVHPKSWVDGALSGLPWRPEDTGFVSGLYPASRMGDPHEFLLYATLQ